MNADSKTQSQSMAAASCGRCCANCRFAMPVEHQGEPLLVCPYRQACRGRLAAVEPQEACPEFRERVRPKEGPEEGTCFIPLVNMDGLCALVDAADYEWLSRYTWRAVCTNGGTFYAGTYCAGKTLYMHRMIMKPPEGMVVDHKNRYGLDNHRINLRNATQGQNCANRVYRAGVSGFRGVYPCGDKWQARIGHQWKTVYIGLFDDPAEAARAYDRKAVELHGEFACLNFPEEAGRRIVCLRGTARVCRAVVARVCRMLYGSSRGPLVPPPFVEGLPFPHGPERACRCHAEEEPALPVFLRAGERHSELPPGLATARSVHAGCLVFTRHYFSLGPSATPACARVTPFLPWQQWACRCHPERAGRRALCIPVAWRWVPLWARGPPWWAEAEPQGRRKYAETG